MLQNLCQPQQQSPSQDDNFSADEISFLQISVAADRMMVGSPDPQLKKYHNTIGLILMKTLNKNLSET